MSKHMKTILIFDNKYVKCETKKFDGRRLAYGIMDCEMRVVAYDLKVINWLHKRFNDNDVITAEIQMEPNRKAIINGARVTWLHETVNPIVARVNVKIQGMRWDIRDGKIRGSAFEKIKVIFT